MKAEFGLFNGREDDEYTGVGFVEKSKTFTTWDEFSFGTALLAGVYYLCTQPLMGLTQVF